MTPADLHARLAAAVTARLDTARKATPGPWVYNSYNWVGSAPLVQPYETWVDWVPEDDHSLEHYGTCPVCGDWKQPPYLPSPGLGHGCRLFDDYYRLEPTVARVPAHHGDTAVGAHRWDAEHIAANDPAFTIRDCERDLRVLARHRPQPTLHNVVLCSCCGRGGVAWWPCAEVRDLAHAYDLDVEPAGVGQS